MIFKEYIQNPRRIHALKVRSLVEQGIREFFLQAGFLETRTPTLVKSPGMEIHIRPMKLDTGEYLPTSPEFAMKKLLAGGLEKIFQISPAFRDEPSSHTHAPEFTMLEWYRTNATYEKIMDDVEQLMLFLSMKVKSPSKIKYLEKWPRISVNELFKRIVEVDLTKSTTKELLAKDCQRLGLHMGPSDSWNDLFFRIWLEKIESKLPSPCIVYDYPESQKALAVVQKDANGHPWAKRFEFYVDGLELGNAFEELTNHIEQEKRFRADMLERQSIYSDRFPPNPIDNEFIDALEQGLPPCAGIAVGVDRLVMLFAGESEISFTQWLPAFRSTK